jgi:hypothetical protein
MIYDQIPDIVITTVRSLYNASYIDANAYTVDLGRLQLGSIGTLLPEISLVLCAALAAFIAFVMVQRRALKTPEVPTSAGASGNVASTGALRGRWDAIAHHLDSPREADWKVAVIEADKLVDDALAKAGFPGETFGDRLSNIQPGTLLSLDGVWWAHKVRNRLAHETDYFLRYTEAKQAVGYFEAALAELQLL